MKRTVSLLAAALTVEAVVASLAAQTSKNVSDLEKNKVLAHRFHMEVIQRKDLDLADKIIAPNCVFHMPRSRPTDKKGAERAKEIALNDWEAFPKGMEFLHEHVLAEGDLVGFRWTLTGITASGEKSQLAGIDIVKIENGKIVEMWIEWHSIRDGAGR